MIQPHSGQLRFLAHMVRPNPHEPLLRRSHSLPRLGQCLLFLDLSHLQIVHLGRTLKFSLVNDCLLAPQRVFAWNALRAVHAWLVAATFLDDGGHVHYCYCQRILSASRAWAFLLWIETLQFGLACHGQSAAWSISVTPLSPVLFGNMLIAFTKHSRELLHWWEHLPMCQSDYTSLIVSGYCSRSCFMTWIYTGICWDKSVYRGLVATGSITKPGLR